MRIWRMVRTIFQTFKLFKFSSEILRRFGFGLISCKTKILQIFSLIGIAKACLINMQTIEFVWRIYKVSATLDYVKIGTLFTFVSVFVENEIITYSSQIWLGVILSTVILFYTKNAVRRPKKMCEIYHCLVIGNWHSIQTVYFYD